MVTELTYSSNAGDNIVSKSKEKNAEGTVNIILAIDQLNTQILFFQYVYYIPLHVSSTMCSSSGGKNCIIQHPISSHL